MAPVLTPVDVGFAEFVSLLLSETLESVLSAQISQEQQRQALLDAVTVDIDDFANGYVTEVDIDLLLIEIMPDGTGGTTVVAGGKPPTKISLTELGVSLRSRDVSGAALTDQGVERIRDAARSMVANRRLSALRESAKRGLPRIVIDEGRIVAKLTFSTVVMTDEEGEDGITRAAGAPPITGIGRAGIVDVRGLRLAVDPSVSATIGSAAMGHLAQAIPAAVKDIRLIVKPASTRDPQAAAEANVYGEVELSFQTIF